MTTNYRFNIYIIEIDEDRKREVVEALKHLHPTAGKIWFKQVLNDVENEGRSEAVYQTNSANDWQRTAHYLNRRGAVPELEDTMPPDEEEELF